MYICNECNKVSNPGEKMNKLVVQTRRSLYRDPVKGHTIAEGTEIVKEIPVCAKCFSKKHEVKQEVKEQKTNFNNNIRQSLSNFSKNSLVKTRKDRR